MPRISASEREATRLRLIEAGKAEFAERGLAGARFDEISLAAGHAKGTIYNYFDGKEELFFTIVEEWCELLAAGFDPGHTASARERLLQIAALDVEIARKDPDLARVVVQQTPALTGANSDAVADSVAAGLDLVADVIARGLATGEFESPLPTRTLARLFLGALNAVELEALLPGATIGLHDVEQLIDRHFLGGLVAA
jgi:AcrR family transcriptional regulator